MNSISKISRSLFLAQQPKRTGTIRKLSSNSFLEADSGKLATHTYHIMSTSLALLTPVVFLAPDKYSDSAFGKAFGVLLASNIASHSWIGVSYVVTDYVPKVSKALLMPARVANLGLSMIIFAGLSKISISSPGGIKGLIKGLWDRSPKKDSDA